MLDPTSAIPVLYLRHIRDRLRGMGVDVHAWLARSAIDPGRLEDDDWPVSHALFERLVVDALALSSEPALGLLVGERLVPSSHGILGYAAMNARTLREAIELFERFVRLRIALVGVSHAIEGDVVRVRFVESTPLGPIRRTVLEAVVLAIENVLDAITLGACPVLEVAFEGPAPPYVALANDMFRRVVRYDAEYTGFAVPYAMLDAKLTMADGEAFQQAARICQRELDKLVAEASLAARVRRLLLEKQTGFPSLTVTARMLHVTPRTLHRRLVAEGTSYRAILEDVRHVLAVEHLKADRFGIEEIAYLLGYTDLANFRRAFKRWESIAPSEFRARHRAPNETRPSR